jgi:nicotinate-nucleotide pyrophosphorylase (carboxylating)
MIYSKAAFAELIDRALREDLGDGDHSALSCIPEDAHGKAQLLIKEEGVLAGLQMAEWIFEAVDADLEIEWMMEDGDHMKVGDIAFVVAGSSRSILSAERLVLNTMQRMSGIATKTAHFQSLLDGTKARVLDTRKTTPGLRLLEKWAVQIGGGTNHRIGLYDLIMIKDNHIDFAGGIDKAVHKARTYLRENGKDLKIEVEARDLDEVQEILDTGHVDRIMLDNFNFEDTRKAVELIGNKAETESSGGIDEKTIRGYAECGVDYISVGALTHSIHNLDMSLKAL